MSNDTDFTDGTTHVLAAWLNDINDFVFNGAIPSGGHSWVDTGFLATNYYNKSETDTVAAADKLGVGQSYSSPTRAVNTTYQNTGTKPILVIVSFENNSTSGSTTNRILCDSSSSPTTVAAAVRNTTESGELFTFTIIVPPGYYYKLNNSAGGSANPTISSWTELS